MIFQAKALRRQQGTCLFEASELSKAAAALAGHGSKLCTNGALLNVNE